MSCFCLSGLRPGRGLSENSKELGQGSATTRARPAPGVDDRVYTVGSSGSGTFLLHAPLTGLVILLFGDPHLLERALKSKITIFYYFEKAEVLQKILPSLLERSCP